MVASENKEVNVGSLERKSLGPLLFLLYTMELFSILKKKLIGMPMTPLWCPLCYPHALELPRISMIHDIGRVSEWRDHWGRNWIWVRQDYDSPQTPPLKIGGTVPGGAWWPWYIGSDIWFQDHLVKHHLVKHKILSDLLSLGSPV